MPTQQEFLREAMAELGLKREDFALRLACPKRTLDKWLMPSTACKTAFAMALEKAALGEGAKVVEVRRYANGTGFSER